MTIVVSNRQRVHFTMEGERGAFLILYHGLFGSQRDWYRAGYVEALANDFRLILPDARGHGRSDRPEDPAEYAPELFSADLLAVLNDLDIRNAHFVGYGLGSLVGFDLITRNPDRVRLIMLGGESPAATPEVLSHFREAASRIRSEGLGAWLHAEREAGRLGGEGVPDEETEREPAAALLEGLAGWEVPQADSFQAGSPITIFSASEDPAFERTQVTARKFQRARFIPFPGLTHRDLFERKDALLEALLRFIKISRRPENGSGDSAEQQGDADGRQQLQERERFQERQDTERAERDPGQSAKPSERRGRRGGRADRRGGRRDRPWRDRRPGGESSQGTENQELSTDAGAQADGQAPPVEPERTEDVPRTTKAQDFAGPVEPGNAIENRESDADRQGEPLQPPREEEDD